MKQILLTTLAGMVMMSMIGAADFDKSEQESISKTLSFATSASERIFRVDNIFGSITVSGGEGKDVHFKAVKTIRADSIGEMEKARREVRLDIKQKADEIELYVDGPFRDKHGSCNWHGIDYMVKYDFDITLPKGCDLRISTVNEGDIVVRDLHGKFKVNNVNGKITMSNINGSGKAHTVNGSIRVGFLESPKENCSFETINGDVELKFAARPSADFWCKTFNGSVYSDFDLTHLPMRMGKSSRKEGKFIYKSNDFQGVRIGQGGIDIKMDSLNGDLIIADGQNNSTN